MTTHRNIVDALARSAADGKPVVMGTVVHVTGSSYGGVGARMLVHADESTVGLVSGGCLEADLAEHARWVRESGVAKVVTYDTRADDDAAWGLGLGCNGLIEVLLEPLQPAGARDFSLILEQALSAAAPTVLATVIANPSGSPLPALGAHALLDGEVTETIGDWGDREILGLLRKDITEALSERRRGLVRSYGEVNVAFEVIVPAVRLVVCGNGPDVIPLVHLALELGWNTTVVDHRPIDEMRSKRFLGAAVVECTDPSKLEDSVAITPQTACVVMSHSYTRDLEYVGALLTSSAAYIGALGPRKRTERMLAEINRAAPVTADPRLFAPIGIDIGAEGPDGIALSIIAEVAAVMGGRQGGHLRDRSGSLHGSLSGDSATSDEGRPTGIGAVILAAGASARFGSPKQVLEVDGQPLIHLAVRAAIDANLEPVIVVLGANASTIAGTLTRFEEISVVVNDDWESGQASSLAVGIDAARNDDLRGVIVMLADQPGVGADSLTRLTSAFDSEHRVIAAAYSDTVGAPVLFGAEYLPALTTLSGDHGAGGWLRAHRDAVTAIGMEEAALDIDTPADFFLHSPRHGIEGKNT